MVSVPLGRGEIQGKSGNLLMNGYHPDHGWLWTDGQSVFLLPCQNDGVIEDAKSDVSRKLGDYGKVIHLSWSSALKDQSQCFLAVQEPHSVTIWQVTGRNPNQQFTLKKKLEGMKQIIGIIWHPLLPIICILSSLGTSVCSLNPDWSVNLSSNHHTTGCWTPDGQTLVLAENKVLEIYLWEDICISKDKWREKHMTFKRYQGKLRSLVGLSSKKIIATTDLPLVEIIHQSNQDLFEPLVINTKTNTSNRSLITELSSSCDAVSMVTKEEDVISQSRLESIKGGGPVDLKESLKEEIMKCGKGPVDLTAMMTVFSESRKIGENQEKMDNHKSQNSERLVGNGVNQSGDGVHGTNSKPTKDLSPAPANDSLVGASSLFLHETFVKKEELSGSKRGWNPVVGGQSESCSAIPVFKQIEKPDVEETANIHLIDLSSKEPTILDSCKLPGLITPDLVTLQQSSILLVGSRNSASIQRFEVKDRTILRLSKPVRLDDQERPVGITCGPSKDILSVLVSKPVSHSLPNVFPSSRDNNQVELYLRQMNLDV